MYAFHLEHQLHLAISPTVYTIYKVLTLYMSHTQISVFIVGLILSLQGCVLYNLVITLICAHVYKHEHRCMWSEMNHP